MSVRNWTTTSAKYGAAFLLGGASLGGLAWSLNRQSAAVVQPAPAAVEPRVPGAPITGRAVETPSTAPDPKQPPAGKDDAKTGLVNESAPNSSPASQPEAPSPAHKVNLNTATQAELELLPGIGPALAQRILEFRAANGKFTTVDQLDSVKGIGQRTLTKLRPLVSVE